MKIMRRQHDRLQQGLIMGVLGAVLVLVSACQAGDQGEGNTANDAPHMPQAPIEVNFFTDPDSGVQAGETTELIAEVSQDGALVDDAELVRFEIWHEEQDQEGNESPNNSNHSHGGMDHYETEHEMLEAEHRGDGQYVLEYTFEKSGTYFVMYHVDARGMHAMTKHEVEVQ